MVSTHQELRDNEIGIEQINTIDHTAQISKSTVRQRLPELVAFGRWEGGGRY